MTSIEKNNGNGKASARLTKSASAAIRAGSTNGAASSNGATEAGRHSPLASIPVSTSYQRDKVRVAIIGVGNCASAFVQGVHYYAQADPQERVPGLMHVDLGGYHVRDIEFTAAFDIDRTKVGKDLGTAIWAGQNNTTSRSTAG
jgi:hypothetical protein